MARRRKRGGRTEYTGQGSNVMKEAHERSTGGRVAAMPSGKSRGGFTRRARGGGVGSDRSPFSSAATGKNDRARTSHTVPVAHPKGG